MSQNSPVIREKNLNGGIPDNFLFPLIYLDMDMDTDTEKTSQLGGETSDL